MSLDRELVIAALPAYEVGAEIGRGGWGIVLGARHRQLGREVAIKQLPRAFAADPAVRARFLNEARLLAGLDHPHIVPVYDFVEHEGVCLLVMEKLGGGTVWSRFTGDGLSMDASCAVTLATCAALQFAHQRGVLHRDIKPENLLFTAGEVLKVSDFGIAKVIGGPQTLATSAGEVLGTPAYMAPEQAQSKALSPATDVYSAGMMLYELFSGQLPFDDDGDALALLYRHVFEPPRPLQEIAPTVPAAVAEVVMRALATDPSARYPSAEAFGVALAEAATAAWGPGWLGRGDMPVMAATSIMAATERPSGPAPEPSSPPRDVSGPTGGADAGTPGPPSAPAGPPSSLPPAGPVAAPPSGRIRPSVAVSTRGHALADAEGLDLVPVHRVLPTAASPTKLIVGALVLLGLVLVLARVGLGTPAHAGHLERTAQLNGAPVSPSSVIDLDLSSPVVLTWASSPDQPAVTRVVVRLTVVGVSMAEAAADATSSPDGTFSAVVDLSGSRLLMGGQSTAEIEMRDAAGTVVGHGSYPISTANSRLLTIPGIAGVVLLLFLFAYAESLLRSRRRGRKAVTAPVAMVIIGAVGGVALDLLAWVLGSNEPVVATLVACAVLGGASGLVATLAAGRIARRRRLRRPVRAAA